MSKKVITFIGGGNGTHVGASLCGINKLLEVRNNNTNNSDD